MLWMPLPHPVMLYASRAFLFAVSMGGMANFRLVSEGFILPTVSKVFLVDMSGLEGAWRAMSFIGLGGALIGIGLVYQRIALQTAPRGN